MKYRFLTVFASLGLALSLSACGTTASSSQPASAPSEGASSMASSMPVSSGASSPASSESKPESASASENMVSGTGTDATMNTIVIETDSGLTLSFATEGAEMEAGVDGLLIGDAVTIYYTGTLNEAEEGQTVTVSRVVVQAA